MVYSPSYRTCSKSIATQVPVTAVVVCESGQGVGRAHAHAAVASA